MIEISELNDDRWEDYRDLTLEALKNDPIAFSSSYEEVIKLPVDEWKRRIKNAQFAMSNNKPIGMIVYILSNRIKTKHICDIFSVYVNKNYRNQGVGKKLIETVIAKVKENKEILKIKLTVNPEQKAAVNLYQRCGFKIVGRLKDETCFEGRFYDELLMEKIL